jgi:glycolate oxidase
MEISKKLHEIVGKKNFSDSREQLLPYATDLSYSPAGMPNYVVKPANSKEISAVIKFCSENRVPEQYSGNRPR